MLNNFNKHSDDNFLKNQSIFSGIIFIYFQENKKKETEDNIKMVDFLTGSRFNQTDLCILMAGY